MRLVEYRDSKNRKRWAYIRDSDPDDMAPHGIPVEPPDLNEIDWEALKNEIAEVLAAEGLFTWLDVERSQTGLTPALNVLKRSLIRLFRQRASPK